MTTTEATGIVLRVDAKVCVVDVDGAEHALPLRGRLFEDRGHEAQPVAVGDRVRVHLEDDEGAIEERLPRTSKLARARRGVEAREHVLAANVSLVLVTASAVQPPSPPAELYQALEPRPVDAAPSSRP